MRNKRIGLILFLAVLIGTALHAQAPDAGTAELKTCLVTLLNDPQSAFDQVRQFQISQPKDQAPSITVRLVGEQLDYFQCPNFTISTNTNGFARDLADSTGKQHRGLTFAEVHNLRPWVSLDPFWVLCHVNDTYADFTYRETPDGQGVFDRQERVPLAAPSEQLYGLFEETLVVDVATHTVRSYAVLALNADRVPEQDVVNDYVPNRTTGPDTVIVLQGPARSPQAPVQYTVTYKKQ